MTTRKTTKKALLGSLLALVLCFSMLVGTTFAWFTDNEVLSDNKITAGTLDITAEKTTVFNVDSLWEPGYSEPFGATLKNVGSLWLKYEVNFANVHYGESTDADEIATEFVPMDSNITEVLDVYVGTTAADMTEANYLGTVADLNDAGTFGAVNGVSGILAPRNGAAQLNLIIKMQETAGNEYQGDWCEFDIVVNATQWTEEEDGFGNDQYDAEADFAVAVGSEAELAAALGNGQNVIITEDFSVENTITVTGDAVIDLNANVDASVNITRPFNIEDGASLTINGADKEVKVGKYGLANIPANGEVILNGGIYTANTDNGAFIKVRDDVADVNVVMNDVTYVDQADDGFVVHTGLAENTKITVNGGNFTANAGFAAGGDLSVKNATIKTAGVAFEVMGDAVIDNCDITIDPGVTVSTAPPAAVAVSNGGYAKVTNNTFAITNGVAYFVYSTGGDIDAANNNINTYTITKAGSTISIDGVEYVG